MTAPAEDPVAQAGNVLCRFFRYLDEGDGEAMADLLDGTWHRRGEALSSREDLLKAMSGRSTTRRIHHLLTNICGEAQADGSVDLNAYMLVVSHDSGSAPEGPSPLEGVNSIRPLACTAFRGPDGWRIRHLKSAANTFERGA